MDVLCHGRVELGASQALALVDCFGGVWGLIFKKESSILAVL